MLILFQWIILLLPAAIWLGLRQQEHLWWAENLTSFPAPVLLCYALLSLILLVRQRWAKGVSCVLVVMLFMPTVVPAQRDIADCRQPLTVVQFNLFYDNPDVRQFINVLLRKPVDLVVMQELTPEVGRWLHLLNDVYPYYYGGQHGVGYPSNQMILSQYPLADISVYHTPDSQEIIRASWHVPKQAPLTLMSAHPPSPRTQALWHRRNALIQTIERLTELYPTPEMLLVGDFNLSAASVKFSNLFPGFTTAPVTSWPTSLFGIKVPQPFMIGIDHLWLKSARQERIICSRHSSRHPSGSDHRMVTSVIGVR
ncbi:endonuclease/exonuclease/phosphatase family protein [Vibrio sp. CAU 1672]|uniref:endonuclease/exonuclease/phosphatase family protein n=1 Tax=Vibrio sp. CAU 1672 TaxID=3032594 RepID=UPI0023DBF5CF|nr:endonuclease/exonuclease/phosphatase family protein [Vibrio sp. CAU 1672]MDF2152909.1 endonuclease/exonuclease/phosphatase family protein [Vibrio sp. CAU 1672]